MFKGERKNDNLSIMNNFSKLSLYDFLTMLIPGFVILWFLDFFGLDAKNIVNNIFIGILSYLTGLCYHKLVEWICDITHIKRNECMQKKAWNEFYKKIGEKESRKIPFPKNIDKYYVAAYYKIAKNGCLMNIPILEAQEAFLRNIFLLILVTICKIACCNITYYPCCLVIFLFILLALSIVTWYCIQTKIYYLVWEGDYYLMQGDEILSNNQEIKKENE